MLHYNCVIVIFNVVLVLFQKANKLFFLFCRFLAEKNGLLEEMEVELDALQVIIIAWNKKKIVNRREIECACVCERERERVRKREEEGGIEKES